MGRNLLQSASNIIDTFMPCKEIFITFGVLFLPAILAAPRVRGTEFNDPSFLLAASVLGIAQIALILYLLSSVGNRKFRDYGILPPAPRTILLGLLAFILLAAVFLILLFTASLLPREWIEAALPEFRWSYSDYTLLPLVVLSCFISAYREELYFRSYLLTEFSRLGSSFPAAAAASLGLFALGHLYQGVSGFVVALVLGFYLTMVFRRSRSLHVPAIAHGLYNLAVLMASGYF